MSELNKCPDVMPGTIVKAGAAIKQHQQNEINGVFNAVDWARSIVAKAMIGGAQVAE